MKLPVLVLGVLINSTCYSQEFSASMGVNANRNPASNLYTTTHLGLSATVSYQWMVLDSIPFRFSLAQENYTSELRYAPTIPMNDCEYSNMWQASEVNNIAIIIYPLNYQIKKVMEISLGMQVTHVLNNKLTGCWLIKDEITEKYVPVDLAQIKPIAYYHNTIMGVNLRIAGSFKMSNGWKIVPEYSFYGTPMQEFSWFVGGSTVRQYLGFGVSLPVNYKSSNE